MANHRPILPRRWRLLVFTAAVLLVFWIAYLLRSILFPFMLGLLVAYLLRPVVGWVEERVPTGRRFVEAKRGIIVALADLLLLFLFALLVFFLISMIVRSFSLLFDQGPEYAATVTERLREWLATIRARLSPEMQAQLDRFLSEASNNAGNIASGVISRGLSIVPTTIGFLFGFAALPVFLFYLLKDWANLSKGFYSAMPHWASRHAREVMGIIGRVMGRYLRAQFIMAVAVGVLSLIGLLIVGAPSAPILATLAGVTEVIPIIGPWIGGIVGVLVTLAVAPEKTLWVAVVFLVVQLVENQFLVPKLQGTYLHMNPAVVILLIVLGGSLVGFWGLLLIVPVTATLVEILKYVAREDAADGNVPAVASVIKPPE